MPIPKYQKGDTVMGRWPGSSLYYEVNVLGFDAQTRLYTVIYKDGTELELKEQDVMSLTSFQSRSRSRSRSRSPGRRRSQSRSPARSTRRSSSPARSTRRSSSRTASAVITEVEPSSRRDTRRKDTLEIRLSPLCQSSGNMATKNNCRSKLEMVVENNIATQQNVCDPYKVSKIFQTTEDPEKSRGRYNLRRRKDDGDITVAETKAGHKEEKEKNISVAPTAVCTPLDSRGKIGAYVWLLFLPPWVLFVLIQVSQEDPSLINFPSTLPSLETLCDFQACGFVLLWILFQALLYFAPFGKLSEGIPLRSGKKLKYRTNGFFSLVFSAMVVVGAVYKGLDITYIHSHFFQLATASLIISVLLSIYLYTRSCYAAPEQLALGGNSGSVLYDFIKGCELNPRIGDFDLKFFFEMRPGLIGWCLINFAMALAEMKQQALDAPSYSMILVNLFQLLYVMDGLWNEEAILTAMDLMHDGFGFMLAFGDLVVVPFTYTLQAYYLVGHPNPLTPPALAAIILLKLTGFYIFRKSNSEKNAFRKNPSDPKLSNLKTIPTATGKSLLVSGWWGTVRHPNYLGDLIMALAWSLPCGFSHLLPWHYMIYFIILLMHRDLRNMNECRKKYGSAWDEYCQVVRYRIIPGVY
ncbi:delta(14)-sterol reductase LBR isoform 2-T2 [Menidia menidia]